MRQFPFRASSNVVARLTYQPRINFSPRVRLYLVYTFSPASCSMLSKPKSCVSAFSAASSSPSSFCRCRPTSLVSNVYNAFPFVSLHVDLQDNFLRETRASVTPIDKSRPKPKWRITHIEVKMSGICWWIYRKLRPSAGYMYRKKLFKMLISTTY